MKKRPNGSIEISPKYGVNPTIPVCAFCGKEKNEIALMGRMRSKGCSDIEAPRQMIVDYEPCDECQALMSKGCTIFEVSETPIAENQPPMQESDGVKLYPTGTFVVLHDDDVKEIFEESVANRIVESRQCLMPGRIVQQIIAMGEPSEDLPSSDQK